MPIFGFFPFFMLGHTYSRENLWEIHTTKNAICFFVAPFIFFIALSFAASSGSEPQDSHSVLPRALSCSLILLSESPIVPPRFLSFSLVFVSFSLMFLSPLPHVLCLNRPQWTRWPRGWDRYF